VGNGENVLAPDNVEDAMDVVEAEVDAEADTDTELLETAELGTEIESEEKVVEAALLDTAGVDTAGVELGTTTVGAAEGALEDWVAA